jgi:hypothetical protein
MTNEEQRMHWANNFLADHSRLPWPQARAFVALGMFATFGGAETILRRLCASGEVRTWRDGRRLKPSAWQDAPDLDGEVEVSNVDLTAWVAIHEPSEPPPSIAALVGKQPRVIAHLQALLPERAPAQAPTPLAQPGRRSMPKAL